ncbi:nucleotidyltransferase family protein [Longimicrobium sp.]|uniref:nucleotidyltransferase domain-containing protein n=1 Tax=Longimicrobium sp. TaxID=2029185 RepID=UPI002E3789A2|nr:nucleotidyltransferase family protein [Longimicrobium sp.]HEX6039025.1 nucleotidyltransferase family protein [Longimicrobium sp.]
MMPILRPHPPRAPDASAPPAHTLLRACTRASFDADGAAPALAQTVASGVDWDAFLALAERNRLLPLAHRALAERADVPETVRSHLRSAYAVNARHALQLAGELRRLLDALDQAGVRALAYKGPALAVRAYGHLALRTYSDLDLLVRPADVPTAEGVLRTHGYVSTYHFTPAQDAAFRRVDGDYPYHHPRTGGLVELHGRVSSTRFVAELPTERLMARARPVPIGGGDVPAPADDDLFLALCLHGAKHRWARLEWLACAAALAVRAAVDLSAVLRRAGEAGARRATLLALLLARDALGLALPADVEASIETDQSLDALAAEARGLWFADDVDTDEATPANLRFNARLMDGPSQRARYAARWLFLPSPEDWTWVRLPDALAPLYRVLRPLRLAARYGRRRGG